MELKRRIENKLNEWLDSKYALLVYGSRQVGKTHTVNHFLKEKFNNYYYLNLHQNVRAIRTIIGSKNVDDFLLRLTSLDLNSDIKEDTCIFIDEIQEYYTYLQNHKEVDEYFDILSEAKYIVSETKHRFVMSGSLLRLELNDLITNPTGYVLPLEMYPLDFEEFLIANNVNQKIIDQARYCFDNLIEVPDYIHDLLMDLFKKYLLVGGMPQAVSEFIDKNSFIAVENAHKAIEYFIREDITKYASDNEKLRIKEIYNLIPTELSSLSRRFIISDIAGHKKNDNEQLSFSWLNSAGITIPVYAVSNPVIPLKISSVRNKLKLFHEDVGILTHLLFDFETKEKILSNDLNVNFGPIYENAVAQNLYSHGFHDIYYFNSKKYGEVDFLIESKQKVLPIEVKSGKNYPIHRALNNIMDIKEYNLESALVFTNNNVSIDGKIVYLPIYMVMFLWTRKNNVNI